VKLVELLGTKGSWGMGGGGYLKDKINEFQTNRTLISEIYTETELNLRRFTNLDLT
jgi:hypothetical protein